MLILSQYVDILIGPDVDNGTDSTNETIIANQTDSMESSTTNSLLANGTNSTNNNEDNGSSVFEPDVLSLTIAFFFLTFFAATQDVAVDGWALTMLKPKNVGYASTCNSIGQTTGWCLGYILYTVLDDAGYLDLAQFFLFWGIVFIVTTVIIAIFKKERNKAVIEAGDETAEEPDIGIVDTYKIIFRLLVHPLALPLIFFLLTAQIGWAASEDITNLKLVSAGTKTLF